MLRSLYSGISGLRAHQTMLDVTGNNIANVNTAGFKSSNVQFQDTLSQVARSGSAAQAAAGGTNPAQVGLGVQVAGIATNFSQGSAQATGRSSDMMISGDGFFITAKGGEQLYARAGSFDFDSQGRLVSPDGALLQGWQAVDGVVNAGAALTNITVAKNNGNAAGTLESFSMGNDGTLTGTFSNGENMVIGRVALANFTNSGGLEKAGASSFRATASSGVAAIGTGGTNGLGALSSGYLEMSNVDLSQEFTNLIVAQRGFQSNARIITTSDEVLQELTQLKR